MRLGMFFMESDSLSVRVGLFTTTFWFLLIVSAPAVDTAGFYGITFVNDLEIALVIGCLLVSQFFGLFLKRPPVVETFAIAFSFLIYAYAGFLSLVTYPGGLGSMMFIPAAGAIYLFLWQAARNHVSSN